MKFVARQPEAGKMGFWISKLASPRADLADLWMRSKSTKPDEVQAFWNNDMGVPYEPKGARLSLALLRSCIQWEYRFPSVGHWCAMGVDVGVLLNVWVAKVTPEGLYRAMWIGTVEKWHELDTLMVRYGVGCCVVDDAPELREDIAFARRWPGKVFLATYVKEIAGARWTQYSLPDQKVRIERSSGLDESHNVIMGQRAILPEDFEGIEDFVDQMCVNLKVKGVDGEGKVIYHFPRTGRPDHYDHAHVYCLAALGRLALLRDTSEEDEGEDEGPAAGPERYQGRGGSLRGQL
jgi:hypothetical protein